MIFHNETSFKVILSSFFKGEWIVFEAIPCLVYQFLERMEIYQIDVVIATTHYDSTTVGAECGSSTVCW